MKQNGIMTPGVPTVLKIRPTTGDNMLESLRLEAERASRCSGERPHTEIFLSSESILIIIIIIILPNQLKGRAEVMKAETKGDNNEHIMIFPSHISHSLHHYALVIIPFCFCLHNFGTPPIN